MTDDSFAKFIRHIMSMRPLTKVELVKAYWQHAHEIAETGRLAFIIRGNVHWKTEQPEGVIGSNGIWLKPNIYDPFEEGRIIGEESIHESILYHTQHNWNTYEIWGTIAIDIDPHDALASKPLIVQAMEKATCVSNMMSLLSGASLRWFPAVYAYTRHEPMPPPPERAVTESWDCVPLPTQDESTSILLSDMHITNKLFPLVYKVGALPPSVRTVIKTAIDWHAQANRYASGLNRFVNYWESIELLGNFFYQKLPAGVVERKCKEQKKEEVMSLLQGVKRDNCMKLVVDCKEIVDPTARTKITGFLRVIANQATDQQRIKQALFQRDVEAKKSLKDIRDDIAHGELSEHDFYKNEKVAALHHRLFDAQKISGEIILRSITCAENLAQQIQTRDGE